MTEQDKFTKGIIEEHRKLHKEYLDWYKKKLYGSEKEERRIIPDEYFYINKKKLQY